MGLAWALELPWRGSDVILSLVIHEEVTIFCIGVTTMMKALTNADMMGLGMILG